MKMCPVCSSDDVKIVRYMNVECLICRDCGFDERDEYDVVPVERTHPEDKMNYSPYKHGGHGRTKK